MGYLHFAEACAVLADLAAESRAAACKALAAAMQQGAADRGDHRPLTVFDPLECLASDASHCTYFGRPLLHEQRVCLVALDSEVSCPQG